MAWTANPTIVAGTAATATEGNIWSGNLTALVNSIGLYGQNGYLSGSPPGSTVPGNLYVQAGTRSGVSSGYNLATSFPNAFPNGVLAILVTPTSIPAGSYATTWSPLVVAASTSGFTVSQGIGSSTLVGFSWLAIGF